MGTLLLLRKSFHKTIPFWKICHGLRQMGQLFIKWCVGSVFLLELGGESIRVLQKRFQTQSPFLKAWVYWKPEANSTRTLWNSKRTKRVSECKKPMPTCKGLGKTLHLQFFMGILLPTRKSLTALQLGWLLLTQMDWFWMPVEQEAT